MCKIKNKLLSDRRTIIYIITMILFTIMIMYIYSFNLVPRSLESQLFEFFRISRDDNISILEIGRNEVGVFYAELIIPADKKNEIFGEYSRASREVCLRYLPPDIQRRVDRLSPNYEVNYYYILFSSLQRGFIARSVVTQSKHIIFMEESHGDILVLLFSTHPNRGWRRL